MEKQQNKFLSMNTKCGILIKSFTFSIRIVVFLSLLFVLQAHDYFSNKTPDSESLFNAIPKADRIKKLLFLPISDFENQEELETVENILSKHSLGGIIIKNGNIEEVKNWISHQKKTLADPPLFILELPNILQFPLLELPNIPQITQVELFSNDSLLIKLGYNIGMLARSSGFDMLMIDPSDIYNRIAFETKNTQWMKHYLSGMNSSGIQSIFASTSPQSNDSLQYSIAEISQNLQVSGIAYHKIDRLSDHNQLSHKARKQSAFDGIILKESKMKEDENSFFLGNDVLILPDKLNESIGIINYYSDAEVLKNKNLKRKLSRVIDIEIAANRIFDDSLPTNHYTQEVEEIYRQTTIRSVVCLKNENEILPFRKLDQAHFASISNNTAQDSLFRNQLDKYSQFVHYSFDYILNDTAKARTGISYFDNIIVNVSDLEKEKAATVIGFLKRLSIRSHVIIAYAGSKSSLDDWMGFSALIWTPINNDAYAKLIPQNLFGAVAVHATFPYKSIPNYDYENPITIPAIDRLYYPLSSPTAVDTKILESIDTLVAHAIYDKTMPGCQILMIKNGSVVYEKSFGYTTYDSLVKINAHSIYDIASITKVVATVAVIMKLEEANLLKVEDSLGTHLSNYQYTDKSHISILNLLRHQSGLKSYIPFWRKAEVIKEGHYTYKVPRRKRWKYSNKNLNINWKDSIQHWIVSSDYNSLEQEDGTYGYLYSDLGFMVLKALAEYKIKLPINQYLTQNIFAPLGMSATSFNPLYLFPKDKIAPTEVDKLFRKEVIWGNVHDKNAALTRGLSGHAGLFSRASDLGIYMQMLLQGGDYGGKSYYKNETILKFTSKLPDSKRRALGWDKPDRLVGNASKYASDASYGHTGFTGTMIWADPKYDLVYIFLSNRVYPNADNNKLSKNNIRTKIHDLMYESFLK